MIRSPMVGTYYASPNPDSPAFVKVGQTVKADDQYLLESILDPDKQIVKGYQPGVMSAVIQKDQVPQDQAQALVDYIKTLK